MASQSLSKRGLAGVLAAATVACLSACTTLVGFGDGVNVLANGSFEDGTQPGGPFKPQFGLMSLPPNSTTMPAWTVLASSGQDVAWVQNANGFVPDGATDGTHFVDLTGTLDKADNGHFGGIKQAFPTAKGVPYELEYDIMVSPVPSYSGPIAVRARISSAADEIDYVTASCPFNPSPTAKQSMSCTLRFVARSDATTLKLFGEEGKRYIGLDRVSVQCVAPLGVHAWCGGAPPLAR